MANSKVFYTGNGSTRNYTVSFPFISRTHIQVRVNGFLQYTPMQYMWTNDSTIQFVNAPVTDDAIEINRITPRDTRLVDFQDGAVLTEAELDLAHNQHFFIAQEIIDNYDDLLGDAKVRLATGSGVAITPAQDIIDAMVQEVLGSTLLADLLSSNNAINLNGENIIDVGLLVDDEIADRLSGDATLQEQINVVAAATGGTVYVQTSAPVPGVSGVPDPIPDGARWYDSDDNNHPYIYSQTTSAWISIADPRVGANASDITALEVALDTEEAAQAVTAAALSVLDTTVTGIDNTLTAVSQDLTTLESTVASSALDIIANAGAVSALTTRVTATEGDITVQAGQITTLISDLGTANGGVTANASALSALTTRVTSAEGDITSTASSVTALTTTVGSNTSTISTQTSSINGIQSKYAVKIDNNGHVSGFGLISTANNGTPVSEFIVAADKFAIVHPSQSLVTPVVPFVVSGGVVAMQNVVIGGALIEDATIGNAKISELSVAKLTGGTFADSIQISSTGKIWSGKSTFASTTAGWFLGNDAGVPKFKIGDANNNLSWNGTTLEINGAILFNVDQVFLQDQTVSDLTNGLVRYRLNANRVIETYLASAGAYVDAGGWLGNGSSSFYEARLVLSSGTINEAIGASNTWLDLATSRQWQKGPSDDGTAVGVLSIRRKSDDVVVATATITLTTDTFII